MTALNRCRTLAAMVVMASLASIVGAQEWWERPWDDKVAPNPDRTRNWYLPSVNEMGGTPEKDNQRDISKSLGRIRKFDEQTLYRLFELRDVAEVMSLKGGFAAAAAEQARPHFAQAQRLIGEAIPLQKAGNIPAAREKINAAIQQLNQGETIAERAIAILAARQHVQHLRNAAAIAQMPELEADIAAMEKRIEADVDARLGDLAAACARHQQLIDQLYARLKTIQATDEQRNECARMLDFYQYLLWCVAKGGNKQERFDGEQVMRDSSVSDLELGAVSTVARRLLDLDRRLRQVSNRMSALAGQPVTASVSDRISARTRYPIDDLNYFTRSKFGILRSPRLMDNNPADWSFNYTHPQADAFSVAGRWQFQIDPKVIGHTAGWFRSDFDDSGWRNLYAPNAWERQGVSDWNPLQNMQLASKLATGQEIPLIDRNRNPRGAENNEHRHYNGMAWYRKTVVIPANWAGSDVSLRGRMGGVFKVYLNGQPAPDRWQSGGNLRIPASAIRFGQPNLLALAVYNYNGNGGLTEGPLWMVREGGTAETRMTAIGGGYVTEEQYGTPQGVVRNATMIGSMTPASILASDAQSLHLWGWSMKGYAVPTTASFATADGVQTVVLDSTKPITTGAAMTQNWLLLNVGAGYGHPIVVVFQRKPSQINWRSEPLTEGLVAEFPQSVGQVAIVRAGRNGKPLQELIRSAQFWSRAALAYPEHASELWRVDKGRANLPFEVMGQFELAYNYHRIADEWNTQPLEIAALPMLASYAIDYHYPGFREGDWQKTEVPVSYQSFAHGEFRAKPGTNRLSYQTPVADNATLWRGVGTLFRNEVMGRAASVMKRWGMNNDRAGLAMHMDWDITFFRGFGLDIVPPTDKAWADLDTIVQQRVKEDLLLILLDFSNDQLGDKDSNYFPHTGGYLRDKPETIQTLARFWKTVALRYRDVSPRHLAYNYNNEPCTIDPEMFNRLIREITRAIREVDQEKWITIDFGDGWANGDHAFATIPTGDPRTVYQYHLYYKHDNIIEGRTPELFYPSWDRAAPTFSNTQEQFANRLLDSVIYQVVHAVPVWCGEFGGSINNPNQEMLLWTEDHCNWMERMGHGWNWWNFDGTSYGRTGLMAGEITSPAVLVLKRFAHRRGDF
jgi:hypothetical protein